MGPRNAELAIEALLVAAGRPVATREIRDALPDLDLEPVLASLSSFWSGRGMAISREGDFVALVPERRTALALAEVNGRKGRALSDAAVATLAVIALHQPVTIADIESLRGVRLSRGLLDSLLDAGLVRVSLRRTDAGRAAAYVTTDEFLGHLGLGALTDLPTPEEVDMLVGAPPGDGD